MIRYPKYRSKYIFLLALFFQLINTHCSRKFTPLSSIADTGVIPDSVSRAVTDKNGGIEYHSKKKLQDFRNNDSITVKPSGGTLADDIIRTAMSYLGIPHCMGGLSRKCIDCSGLVMKVFKEYGYNLPHSAQDQSAFGKTVKEKKELLKGDIVFFKGSYKTSKFITHTGIYLGDNMFIHTSSGKGVTITPLNDSFWKDKFVFGKRLL